MAWYISLMLSPLPKTPCSRITESPGSSNRRSLLAASAELGVRVDPHPLLVLPVPVLGRSLVQWIALEAVGAVTAAAAKHCFLSYHHLMVRKACRMLQDTFDFLFLWFLFY